jgi:hypothetical protein
VNPTPTTGSTYTFEGTFTKDGIPWNLTSATVKLYLHRPDRTIVTIPGTIVSALGGVASATNAASDINMPGPWKRTWEVDDGQTVLRSNPIPFTVDEAP